MWWHPDLLIGVFTPGWITWTDYMPIWAARRLILCLHSTERAPTEYAQRQPPDSAPSAAFQVLSARRVRAALRRREARGRESTWWPQKWLSNQLTAFQLVIVFQHCFIYDSARYQPQHPHPSVCRGIWACEPQRSPQLCLRSCFFFFFPRLRTIASWAIFHKYLNPGSIISSFMPASVQFVHVYVCECMLTKQI